MISFNSTMYEVKTMGKRKKEEEDTEEDTEEDEDWEDSE